MSRSSAQSVNISGIRPNDIVDIRRVLHVGCGPKRTEKLHNIFRNTDWQEVRLDLDPNVKPDILASIDDLGSHVETNSFDAIWSSHNIEHLDTFQVPKAFAEFVRILLPSGFALVTCPDLEAIACHITDHGIDSTLYESPAGPITPLDVLFGHGRSIKNGNHYMRHHTGFTEELLGNLLINAGFAEVRILKGGKYDLWALARMPDCNLEAVAPLFEQL